MNPTQQQMISPSKKCRIMWRLVVNQLWMEYGLQSVVLRHIMSNAAADWVFKVPQSTYRTADSDPEVGVAFRDAVEKVRSLGAVIVDGTDFQEWRPGSGQREDLFGDIMLRDGAYGLIKLPRDAVSDCSVALAEFFGGLAVNPHEIYNVSDLIEFIKRTPEEEYEKFGAEWFENARDVQGSSTSEEFLKSKVKMEHLGQDLVRLLDEHNCDILMATTSTDLPLDLGRLPGISVPLGFYSSDRAVVKNSKGQVSKGPNIP